MLKYGFGSLDHSWESTSQQMICIDNNIDTGIRQFFLGNVIVTSWHYNQRHPKVKSTIFLAEFKDLGSIFASTMNHYAIGARIHVSASPC